jgi:hypothetical protein
MPLNLLPLMKTFYYFSKYMYLESFYRVDSLILISIYSALKYLTLLNKEVLNYFRSKEQPKYLIGELIAVGPNKKFFPSIF